MALQVQSKLLKQYNALKKLDRDFNQVVDNVLETQTDDMERYNRKQLTAGIRSDGSKITPSPYSPGYARKKRRLGKLTKGNAGIINLKLNGGIHAGLKYKVKTDIIEITQVNLTPFYHLQTYGKKIVGLTDDNLGKIKTEFKTKLTSIIKKELNGIR